MLGRHPPGFLGFARFTFLLGLGVLLGPRRRCGFFRVFYRGLLSLFLLAFFVAHSRSPEYRLTLDSCQVKMAAFLGAATPR
ncbi:hypothetical protein MPNT_60072 [Candidatus Methylacidithermus pantelleriae]|uniref:Uncharacterized protein n=1 Tax=Candidatus Methylacidithermus pantelleriae TaxID=2744239 RepID=A0A8J2FTA8_9BACT|nr:hypothetical protein MPNT_60072 [Candidatus Methylacidithermus pantelleriae]